MSHANSVVHQVWVLARKMGFDNEQLAEQMQRSGLFSAPSNRIHRVGSIDKANAVLDEAVVMLYAPTSLYLEREKQS